MLGLLCAWVFQGPVDSYALAIGRAGQTVAVPGRITDLKTGREATADDIAKAADRKLFVFLGEQHATVPDQLMHADVIQALVRRGRHVVVGMEMYQRPKQDILDQWSAGHLSDEDFISQSDWKGQWGYDYGFYRPVFDTVRRFHLPLVGLNVPRAWVHSVGTGGFKALSADAQAQLPASMSLANAEHRQIFDSLMGGHPMTGPSGENIYAAQVLWDEAMADTALKYLELHKPDSRTIFVVIAGAGHVMYGQGINRHHPPTDLPTSFSSLKLHLRLRAILKLSWLSLSLNVDSGYLGKYLAKRAKTAKDRSPALRAWTG